MQYYAIKTDIFGKDYFYDHWIFVSENIDARNAFTKKEAEEHLEFLKSRGAGKDISIILIDYQPSQKELDKLYSELDSLNKEYDFEKQFSSSSDGSLGMISSQIQDIKDVIKELEILLKAGE